ncbi:MAG: diguanylate cyclase [bacterium]|nr:diguanylate cyclase [bacterium]
MKYNRVKKGFYGIVACTILCVAVLLCMTWFQEHSNPMRNTESKLLNVVGEYYINDDGESHVLNKDTKFKLHGINTIKVIGNFTEDIGENMLVILRIDNMRVEIKVNGKQVYSMGQEGTMLEYAHSAGNMWATFHSEGIKTTDIVEMTLTNLYTNHPSTVFNKFFHQMYYGSESGLVIANMRSKLINSFFAMFIIVMGLMTTIFTVISYYMKKSIERVAVFSGLCLFSGIWFFIDFDIQYYLFPAGVFNNSLDMVTLLFMAFFLLWFYGISLKSKARYFVLADALAFFITIIVATILQYTGKMDYYETYMTVYVFGLLGTFVTVGSLLWERHKYKENSLNMLVLSSICLSIGVLADLFGIYFEIQPEMFWFRVGFTAFLCIQFYEIVKMVQRYVTENTRVHVLKEMAYKDAMTGALNRAAYLEKVEKIEERILKHDEFALIVFDINNLKTTNDTMGHDEGDNLILLSSRLLSGVFGENKLYRIGGDEFVVILEDMEYQKRLERIQQFVDACKSNSLEIAYGMAVYNAVTDISYEDVFLKADQAMYVTKKKMKQ